MAIVLLILDQLTKIWASLSLKDASDIRVVDGFFHLSYVENRGAAFSFLADKSYGIYLLSSISLIAIVLLVHFLKRSDVSRRREWILLILLSGALGNFIDRILRNYVIDFLDFRFGSYHFPTFNLADSYLCIAFALLFIDILLTKDEVVNS
ncbi:MAG: signal peptidase II [Eubacteriales bacterium]|nr:signal peptidase II [Eubacteriales bacterium]